MNEPMTPETVTKIPDISVKVFPTQAAGKLLAKASVTLGNCFTINQIKLYDTEKGLFVAMPSERGRDGNFHDTCYPTTKEMREALSNAVIEQYQQTVELISSRGKSVAEKPSVRGALQEAAKEAAAHRPPDSQRTTDREER